MLTYSVGCLTVVRLSCASWLLTGVSILYQLVMTRVGLSCSSWACDCDVFILNQLVMPGPCEHVCDVPVLVCLVFTLRVLSPALWLSCPYVQSVPGLYVCVSWLELVVCWALQSVVCVLCLCCHHHVTFLLCTILCFGGTCLLCA